MKIAVAAYLAMFGALGMASTSREGTLFDLALSRFNETTFADISEVKTFIQGKKFSCRSVTMFYPLWDGAVDSFDPNQWSKPFSDGPVVYRTGDAQVGFAEAILFKNVIPTAENGMIIDSIKSYLSPAEGNARVHWTTDYTFKREGSYFHVVKKFGAGQSLDGKPILASYSQHTLWHQAKWWSVADEVTICGITH